MRTLGGDYLRAVVWRDTFEHPFFLTVSAPVLMALPVRARLGFRTAGAPLEPADLRLSRAVIQWGEEVGASFPALVHVHAFLVDLWAAA